MGNGCSGASAHDAPPDDSGNRKRAVQSLDARRKSTRDVTDQEAVRTQRRRAREAHQDLPSRVRRASSTALEEPLPALRKRLSRLGSASRDDLKSKLARRAKRKVAKGDQRPTLTGRLGGLGLASHEMKGDGNCQFRSFSFNLFGAQSHYAVVRSAAVAHLRTHADFFSVFFDGEREWKRYLEGMAKNKTWGDELTLRAVVEAYGCVAHVITSEPANWYLVYEPEGEVSSPPLPAGTDPPPKGKDVFLSYVSPIHYNSVVAKAPEGKRARL
mmetsp:Transcript_21777/g.67023  ORF Transcript_21777/g.67023 Transcript_21777/m.67023 type:complete len:271 (+) Transcript_21777:582-1394(+)